MSIVKNSIVQSIRRRIVIVRLRYKIHYAAVWACRRSMRRKRWYSQQQWHTVYVHNINSAELLLNCDNFNNLLIAQKKQLIITSINLMLWICSLWNWWLTTPLSRYYTQHSYSALIHSTNLYLRKIIETTINIPAYVNWMDVISFVITQLPIIKL